MAYKFQWGYGLDTYAAASAIRRMEHTATDGLLIEWEPEGLEVVVARHIASGAMAYWPATPSDPTDYVLAMIYAAAHRGVERMFHELPFPWWIELGNAHEQPGDAPEQPDNAHEQPGKAPKLANFSTHHLSAMVPVFAHIPKDGTLWDKSSKYIANVQKGARALMSTTGNEHLARRAEAERLEVVRGFLRGQVPTWVSSYWRLSPDEHALNAFLEDEFHRHGPPERWPDAITFDAMGQVLEGMGWEDNSTNRERLVAALVNLHSVHRPHFYNYKGRTRKGLRWRQFRSLEPLWRVQYETGTGGAIIVKPGDMAALKHQINERTQGVPHYYTTLPVGRFAQLENVAPSTMVASEADDLLVAFLRDAYAHAPEPDNPNEYVLTYTLTMWATQWLPMRAPVRARIRERQPKDEREVELRGMVRAFADECTEQGRKLSDRELAAHLSVDVKEATRLRERAGIVLRAQHRQATATSAALPKPGKTKAKIERALEVLAQWNPGFIIEGADGRLADIRVKEDKFRVRVCPERATPGFAPDKRHRPTKAPGSNAE